MLAELTTIRTQHQQEAMKCEKLSETVQSLEHELVNKEQEIALLKKQVRFSIHYLFILYS